MSTCIGHFWMSFKCTKLWHCGAGFDPVWVIMCVFVNRVCPVLLGIELISHISQQCTRIILSVSLSNYDIEKPISVCDGEHCEFPFTQSLSWNYKCINGSTWLAKAGFEKCYHNAFHKTQFLNLTGPIQDILFHNQTAFVETLAVSVFL